MNLRQMTIADYDEVISLWRSAEGVGLSDADSRENIEAYLHRNPGMSCVAVDGDRIVGASLCGHDGRRGYLHHLAVSAEFRGQSVGRMMADFCLERLREARIARCHIHVYRTNEQGAGFWMASGWYKRDDLQVMSHDILLTQAE